MELTDVSFNRSRLTNNENALNVALFYQVSIYTLKQVDLFGRVNMQPFKVNLKKQQMHFA